MTDVDLDALIEGIGLKDLDRTGWVRRGVPSPESVAAHSWGVALLVLQLLPQHLDRERALAYAVLHDLPEVRVGDLTPHDRVQDKAQREHDAMAAMSRAMPRGTALHQLWLKYEAQQDAEARFVRQLDRVDMALQAVRYHASGAEGMQEFVQSALEFVDDPALVRIVEQCAERVASP